MTQNGDPQIGACVILTEENSPSISFLVPVLPDYLQILSSLFAFSPESVGTVRATQLNIYTVLHMSCASDCIDTCIVIKTRLLRHALRRSCPQKIRHVVSNARCPEANHMYSPPSPPISGHPQGSGVGVYILRLAVGILYAPVFDTPLAPGRVFTGLGGGGV